MTSSSTAGSDESEEIAPGEGSGDLLLGDDGAPLGYGEAAQELEQIVSAIEHAEVDVDELGRQVARASALIAHCRHRLSAVQAEVSAVVEDLADGGSGA